MIYWENEQDKVLINNKFYKMVEDIIDYSLKVEGVTIDWELSITLVDNETIKDINGKFRNIHEATDVLSFPMLSYPYGKVFKECYSDNIFIDADLDDGQLVLGDIILSLERAQEQSVEFNHGFLREVCYLMVHSILHLLGYDHMEPDDKEKMRNREEEILKKFDLSRGA
jgi:probable rRNA maturation factor